MKRGLATSAVVLMTLAAIGCGSNSATKPDIVNGKDMPGMTGMDMPPGQDVVTQTDQPGAPDVPPLADTIITPPDIPGPDGGNFGGAPQQSSTLAINPPGDRLWVVYPDNNAVGVFKIGNDDNTEAATLNVGKEPWSVAFSANGKAYVANFGSNTVSCFKGADPLSKVDIAVGREPIAIAPSPNGDVLYVANLADNSVSVINPSGADCSTDIVTTTITNVPEPSAIATVGTGVFVTRFRAGYATDDTTASEVSDVGRQGEVTVIDARSNTVTGKVVLPAITDTGFSVPPTTDGGMATPTGAFPNLLAGIAFKGGKGYVASIGSSPQGPLNFKFDIQAFVSTFDPVSTGVPATVLNLNVGVKLDRAAAAAAMQKTQDIPFLTNPWAIAFRSDTANVGYITASAVDQLIRFQVDTTGAPVVQTAGAVLRAKTGKNPRGVIVNSTNTRIYVMNYISRDVTVIDTNGFTPLKVNGVDKSTIVGSIVAPGTDDKAHQGNFQFHSAIGTNYEAPDDPGVINGAADPVKKDQFALSTAGWIACASCHPFGREDGVTWAFAAGPRRTIPLTATYSKEADASQRKNRILNWSAIFDEVQDFELNSRGVAGGRGLFVDATATQQATVPFFANGVFTMNTGRPNGKDPTLTQDNMDAYLRTLRAPTIPTGLDPTKVTAGRKLFAEANCVACHSGPTWGGVIRPWDNTGGTVTNAPPLTDFFNDAVGAAPLLQYTKALRNVGTFDATSALEKRQNGTDVAQGDHGFNAPSLFGVAARAPYLHHGQARTLAGLLDPAETTNMGIFKHLRAGHDVASGGSASAAIVATSDQRDALVAFIQSIDETTTLCTPPLGTETSPTDFDALCP